MAVANVIDSVFGMDDFANYEQSIYNKYQEIAEREIVNTLKSLLSSTSFLQILKAWGSKCACKFFGFRLIKIQLKSGEKWEILSPVFLKSRSKKKAGLRNDIKEL
ncbi:MAG: hypothetical protein GY714_00980 [Desulfobacterales bacterium]|nr:hypothetical protein [Desulfobacterales bacterium]